MSRLPLLHLQLVAGSRSSITDRSMKADREKT